MRHDKDIDYLHAAARVAYLENQLITKDDLFKAINAGSAEEAFRLLSGKGMFRDRKIEAYEQVFEESLTETYELVEDMTGHQGLTCMFRYPIDGHNLKVMVKGKLVSGDCSNLYKTGGTVPAEILQKELDSRRFETVPGILGDAGLQAEELLARTKDSQGVDRIIDQAVIALMCENAIQLDLEVLAKYVMVRIDWINMKSALRLMRRGKEIQKAAGVFSEGGSCSVGQLNRAYAGGYDGLAAIAESMPYGIHLAEAVRLVGQGQPMTVFEEQEDGCFRELFERWKFIPFGAEPIIAYLYQKEQEIKACRLVLVSKGFGVSNDQIRERLGCLYGN